MADLQTKLVQAVFSGYPNGLSVPSGSQVTFHPSSPMMNITTRELENFDIVAPIDPTTGVMGFPDPIGGDPTQFGVRLICNDDVNVKPIGTYWIVRVRIADQNWEEFAILVSISDPDLLTLSEAAEITGATVGVAISDITSVDNTVIITSPRPGVRDLHVTPGGGSGGGDKYYRHVQNTPSTTWVILHNLGKHPAIHAEDSAGEWALGSVHYDSDAQCTVRFGAPFSGTAHCS